MNQALFSFIKHAPTAYHAAAHTAELLQNAGYTLLSEADEWKLESGKGYYVLRNGSSLIAFPADRPSWLWKVCTSIRTRSMTE